MSSVEWGLGQIASANAGAGASVAKSIDIGAKVMAAAIIKSNIAIANAGAEIAASGKDIAKAIFNTANMMSEGLAKITDEMERKRKTEEYYRLLDLIDSLEDKIIALNGDVGTIYDKLSFEYKAPANLTIQEIQLITRMCSPELLEWLCKTCVTRALNPMVLICELISKSDLKFSDGHRGKTIIATVNKEYYDRRNCPWKLLVAGTNIFEDSDFERAYYFEYGGKVAITEGIIPVYEMNGEEFTILCSSGPKKSHYLYTGDYISCTEEEKGKILGYILNSLKEIEYLGNKEMDKINSFKTFVDQLNCDIILGNLRNLHTELLNKYKELKLK